MTGELVTRVCTGTVGDVVARLRAELNRRRIAIFATIDHSGGARSAGLQLPDEVVIVFGNPATGTALMQADPRSGVDLPVRILVWDQGGVTTAAYSPPAQLAERYDLDPARPTLDKLDALLASLVDAIAI